ncbi:MAG: hypothetical protein AAF787_22430 [Chloroflexota bacterium]
MRGRTIAFAVLLIGAVIGGMFTGIPYVSLTFVEAQTYTTIEITGEETTTVNTGPGNTIVDMTNGGSINVVEEIGIENTDGDLVVQSGDINVGDTNPGRMTDGNGVSNHELFAGIDDSGDGGVDTSADITVFGVVSAVSEDGEGSVVNSGTLTTNGINRPGESYGWAQATILEDGPGSVTNNGTIDATNSIAGIWEFEDGDVVNNGDISVNSQGGGVIVEFDDGDVVNNGTINASGIIRGVYEFGAGDVINNGTIISEGPAGCCNADAISESAIGGVVNNGIVIAQDGVGIRTGSGRSVGPVESYTDAVTNTGTVTGSEASIYTGQADDTVINSGTLNGDVIIGSGLNRVGNDDDTLTNSGTINGNIEAGMGDDLVENSGIIDGDLTLGTGNDSVNSSGTITGLIDGGAGEDTLTATGTASGCEGTSFEGGGEGSFGGYSWRDVETVSIVLSGGGGCGGGDDTPIERITSLTDPVAVFCSPLGDSGLEIYEINANAEGEFAFKALRTEDVLPAIVEATTSGNEVEIASGGTRGTSLVARADGQISVRTAGGFSTTVPGNSCG